MIPDLHPEELLNKAASGRITSEESELLSAHLEECAVCRLTVQATRDFARLPDPQLDVEHLVTNALMARTSQSVIHRPRARRWGLLLAAAISLLAAGSLAAVGQWTGLLPRLIAAATAPSTKTPKRSSAPAAVPKRSEELAPVAALPAEQPAPPLSFEAPAEAPVVPEVRRSHHRVLTSSSSTTSSQTTLRSPGLAGAGAKRGRSSGGWLPSASPSVVSAEPLETRWTPQEAFLAANRARLGGEPQLAMARYQEILTVWPSSSEAQQSRATLGRMLLDHGNPSAALEQLDAYLAGADVPLRAEVLGARAVALMQLGRVDEEARVWHTLVNQYPGSIYAVRAKARLRELQAPPP